MYKHKVTPSLNWTCMFLGSNCKTRYICIMFVIVEPVQCLWQHWFICVADLCSFCWYFFTRCAAAYIALTIGLCRDNLVIVSCLLKIDLFWMHFACRWCCNMCLYKACEIINVPDLLLFWGNCFLLGIKWIAILNWFYFQK